MKKNTKKREASESIKQNKPRDTEYVLVYGLSKRLESWLKKTFGITHSPFDATGGDDWSFVIKMHAFVEAALNHLLITRLNNATLEPIIPKLEINARMGKLTLIKAYDLLPQNACIFIEVLSSLRNKATHDVRHLTIELGKYVSGLDPKQLTQWKTGMTCWNLVQPTRYDRENTVRYPRHAIFSCTTWIMANALVKSQTRKSRKQLEEQILKVGEIWVFDVEIPETKP
ncbi:MAG: hypothetical protein ACREIF_16375 [Chthoniobacterales bacterium]